MRKLLRTLKGERGDILVTPAILLLLAGSTLLVGGLVFMGTRQVAPSINNSRQGITLDDDGNVVQGGVGVLPVPSPTPKPTEEPEPASTPRRVIREEVTVVESTPEPPTVIYVGPTPTPHMGGTHTDIETDNDHDDDDDSGDGSGTGGGHGGTGGGGGGTS